MQGNVGTAHVIDGHLSCIVRLGDKRRPPKRFAVVQNFDAIAARNRRRELSQKISVFLLVTAHRHGDVLRAGNHDVEQLGAVTERVNDEGVHVTRATLVQTDAVRENLLAQKRVLYFKLEWAAWFAKNAIDVHKEMSFQCTT